MSNLEVKLIVKQVAELSARAGALPEEAEQAIEKLLNVVEALSADKQELTDEVQRLRKQLEQKRQAKTTTTAPQDAKQPPPKDSDHSSENRRRKRDRKRRPARDRRSFKDLAIHEKTECPVDPATLPPDTVRVEDELVIVQDIEIKPHNIRCQRQVDYSADAKQFFCGPLPSGCDVGDFSANLRALILSLEICGNMSELKIREFLKLASCWIHEGRHCLSPRPAQPPLRASLARPVHPSRSRSIYNLGR